MFNCITCQRRAMMKVESDDESGNPEVIVIHKPEWRSEHMYMYALITIILCISFNNSIESFSGYS